MAALAGIAAALTGNGVSDFGASGGDEPRGVGVAQVVDPQPVEPGLPYGTYDVCVDKPPTPLSFTVSKVKVNTWPGTGLIQFPLVVGVASPTVCP